MQKTTSPKNTLIVLVKMEERFRSLNSPPIGLLYVGDALKKAGYEVRVYHIVESEVETFGQIIVDEHPLFVGLSVYTGPEISGAVALSRYIKRTSDIYVVWGDVHASLLPEQCLQESYIDIVCIGEGEETSVELARAIEQHRDFGDILGIGYQDGEGRIRINPPRPLLKDLDTYKADWSLVDLERYISPALGSNRTLHVTSSRGCPYACTFCSVSALYHRRWRGHSAKFVVKSLTELAQTHHIEAFKIMDANFFVNQTWAWQILEAIQMPYHIELRAEYIDARFAQKLDSTGCVEVLLGHESGSDRVLKEIVHKGATVQDYINATQELSAYPHIKITASFIIGFPGETRADFNKTISVMCQLAHIHPNTFFSVNIFSPYPKTQLHDVAVQRGFVPPSDTEQWKELARQRVIGQSELSWVDWIDRTTILELHQAINVLAMLNKFRIPGIPHIVCRMILQGKYNTLLIRLLNIFQVHYAFGGRNQWYNRLLQGLVNMIKRLKGLT